MSRFPGALLLAVAFGAGLVTGLSRFPDWSLVALAALAATWLLRQERWVAALPTLALGIWWGHNAVEAASRECAATLPLGEHRVTVRATEPGSGSGRVTVTGCPGTVTARWPRSSHLAAGTIASVTARWVPRTGPLGRPEGLLLVTRVDQHRGDSGPIDRLRTSIATATGVLYGSRAPLVDALITGRRGDLDPQLRQEFAAAGMIHLLAISGFHVGLLAGWILLLLRVARAPRHPAEVAAAVAAAGYAAFLGFPAPATRAAGLLLVLAFCRWRQRQVQFGATLGVSALLVMWLDPWSVVEVGAWLSLLAISGMIAATRWSDRSINRHPLTRSLSGSVGATLATAPVSAWIFGRVAPIGIVLNLLAVPVTAVAVPALLASLGAFGPAPVLARAFAASGNLLLLLLERIARVGSAAPGFGDAAGGNFSAALPWFLAWAMAIWIVHDRSTAGEAGRRVAWGATAALWCALLLSGLSRPPVREDGLTLLFLDVGQGDAALIRTPGGHWIGVDAGPLADGWDAGRRVLLPMLRKMQVHRLDAFVLSHAHRDHVGGAASLFAALPVTLAIEPGERFDDSAYLGWLAALPGEGVRWRPAIAGDEWELDGVRFLIHHPPEIWPAQGEDLNEDSLVLEVQYGAFSALFMGDAGRVAEDAMGATIPHVDVLKVGHHGSRGASGDDFLRRTRPEVGIISVGRNRYGHPAPSTLTGLARMAARIWRTDREGTTTVVTDGRQFTVSGGRTTATFRATAHPAPGR